MMLSKMLSKKRAFLALGLALALALASGQPAEARPKRFLQKTVSQCIDLVWDAAGRLVEICERVDPNYEACVDFDACVDVMDYTEQQCASCVAGARDYEVFLSELSCYSEVWQACDLITSTLAPDPTTTQTFPDTVYVDPDSSTSGDSTSGGSTIFFHSSTTGTIAR